MSADVELFETVNSVYEIDRANSRVRRVRGVNEPTPYFEKDGEWREYAKVEPTHFNGLVFFWPNGTATVTSMKKD